MPPSNYQYTVYMDRLHNDLRDDLQSFISREDLKHLLDKYRHADPTEKPSRKEDLRLACMRLNIAADDLISGKISVDRYPTRDEVKEKLLDSFCKLSRACPSAADSMRRIVRRLTGAPETEPVRVTILRQFVLANLPGSTQFSTVSVRKWVRDHKMTPEEQQEYDIKMKTPAKLQAVANRLDDSIFAASDVSETLRDLLTGVDHLANGDFTKGGNTREKLYQFAIVFGMSVHLLDSDPLYDAERDMEKNLFEDYYHDDLSRFLMKKYGTAAVGGYEQEPRGDGINYKNFCEVIYLYYLHSSDPKLTPKKRVENAINLIEDCIKDAAENTYQEQQEALRAEPMYDFTYAYQQRLIPKLLSLPEAELKAFILTHYPVPVGMSRAEAFQYAANESTAASELDEVLNKLAEYPDGRRDALYKAALRFSARLLDRFQNPDDFNIERESEFCRMVEQMVDRLICYREGSDLISGPVGRNRLLVALASDFLASHMADKRTQSKFDSFQRLYDSFREAVDTSLHYARYQRFSLKNVFDLFLLLSIYFSMI